MCSSDLIAESSGAALGCAYLAGFGLGVFKDIREPLNANLKIERTFEPNPKVQDLYLEQFQVYRNIYESTKVEFDKLAKITELGANL